MKYFDYIIYVSEVYFLDNIKGTKIYVTTTYPIISIGFVFPDVKVFLSVSLVATLIEPCMFGTGMIRDEVENYFQS